MGALRGGPRDVPSRGSEQSAERSTPVPWTIARVAAHAAVWLAVVVPSIQELVAGWRPFGDNAAIAIRSYQSLSFHPPLVGPATSVSSATGHTLFDSGPLVFYLLAVPVHLIPTFGLLLGAALLAGLALSLGIEASWSANQRAAAVVVALCVLDLLWLIPSVFQGLPWNAFLPLPFFLSSLVLAWVVCLGKVGWWPVLVGTSSIAGQTHLLFLVPSVVLVVVALVFGLLPVVGRREPRGRRSQQHSQQRTGRSPFSGRGWVVVGLAVGLLCWIAPVIQDIGRNGNLSNLLHSNGRSSDFGMAFGLGQIGQSLRWPLLWTTHPPSGFFDVLYFTTAGGWWRGITALGILAAIAIVSFRLGRKDLAALSVVAISACLSVGYTFAMFPGANTINLGYLIFVIWILALLTWSVFVWALLLVAQAALRRLPLAEAPRSFAWSNVSVLATIPAVAVTGLLSVLVLAGVAGVWSVAHSPADFNWNVQEDAVVYQATKSIELKSDRGPVGLRVVTLSGNLGLFFEEGIAYRLLVDGWLPEVQPLIRSETGLTSPVGPRVRTFDVVLDGTTLKSIELLRTGV